MLTERKLAGRGFRVLGRGSFSVVMGKPNCTRVIKLCDRGDAWPDYVYWASVNGFAGGLAPKVWSIEIGEEQHHRYYNQAAYVAIVERLQPFCANTDDTKRQAYYNLARLLWDRGKYALDPTARAGLDQYCPDWERFVTTFPYHLGGRDFGGSNTMMRADGTFCVSDPLTSLEGKRSIPSRLRSSDLRSCTRDHDFVTSNHVNVMTTLLAMC